MKKEAKLHELVRGKGGRCWCGPAALSIITGRDYDDVRFTLRAVSHRKRIMGVSVREMKEAFVAMGYEVEDADRYLSFERPTLAQWYRRTKPEPGKVYLLTLTNHYVVISGRKIADNLNPGSVFFGKYAKKRQRVRRVMLVS
jgi:hypothetical protein